MRLQSLGFVLVALAAVVPGRAAGKPDAAAAIEVRRFAVPAGVTLPREFPDFLYALLIEKLHEAQLPLAVLGENEVAESPSSEPLVLEGQMLAVKGAWYRGAGEKKLTAEVVLRRGPAPPIVKKQVSAAPNVWTRVSYEDENELWSADALATRIVKEVQNA